MKRQPSESKPHHRDVAQFVGYSNRVVVEQAHGGDVAWVRIICKDDQLVLQAFVPHKVNALLGVGDVDALA